VFASTLCKSQAFQKSYEVVAGVNRGTG